MNLAKFFNAETLPFKLLDSYGNKVYWEDSSGYWMRTEYDSKGNKVYLEDSIGYWLRLKYDADGNNAYWEDSDGDRMERNRHTPVQEKNGRPMGMDLVDLVSDAGFFDEEKDDAFVKYSDVERIILSYFSNTPVQKYVIINGCNATFVGSVTTGDASCLNETTPPDSSIEGLKRYSHYENLVDSWMEESPTGEYVKFSDLPAQSSSPEQPSGLTEKREAVKALKSIKARLPDLYGSTTYGYSLGVNTGIEIAITEIDRAIAELSTDTEEE